MGQVVAGSPQMRARVFWGFCIRQFNELFSSISSRNVMSAATATR